MEEGNSDNRAVRPDADGKSRVPRLSWNHLGAQAAGKTSRTRQLARGVQTDAQSYSPTLRERAVTQRIRMEKISGQPRQS